jgi:hypothetical protein
MRSLMAMLVAVCFGGGVVLASETPKAPAPGKTESHGDVRPAVQKTTGGKAAGKPAAVSPTELARRLQTILDGAAAQQQHGQEHAAAPAVKRLRPRPAPAIRSMPAPLLSWGREPTPPGVALTWDRDIDPRHSRPAPTGVRLIWADSRD